MKPWKYAFDMLEMLALGFLLGVLYMKH